MICKTCSRVLLPLSLNNNTIKDFKVNYDYFYDKIRKLIDKNQFTDAVYVKIRKDIIGVCSKRRICPYCNALNGKVYKDTKSYRILHEKYDKKAKADKVNTSSSRVNAKTLHTSEYSLEYFKQFANVTGMWLCLY